MTSLAVTVAAACGAGGGGGGGGSSGPALTFTSWSGRASIVARAANAGILHAEFYKDATPPQASIPLAIDSCVPAPTAAGPGTSIALDAGASVSFGALSAPSNGLGVYDATGAASVADTDYVLTNAGSASLPAQTLGTLHTPKQPVLLGVATPPPIVPGQPLDLTFTTPTGATFVQFEVTGSGHDFLCNSKDDGAFTIPASVTSAVGASGSYTVYAIQLQKITVAGKEFLLRAETH